MTLESLLNEARTHKVDGWHYYSYMQSKLFDIPLSQKEREAAFYKLREVLEI